MPAFITFGRVLFAVFFIYMGATKLFGIQATADFIASKVTIPALLAPYTSQLETMTAMPLPQLLAISSGCFEILAGLMIAVGLMTALQSARSKEPQMSGAPLGNGAFTLRVAGLTRQPVGEGHEPGGVASLLR